jgi:hypothetical protein
LLAGKHQLDECHERLQTEDDVRGPEVLLELSPPAEEGEEEVEGKRRKEGRSERAEVGEGVEVRQFRADRRGVPGELLGGEERERPSQRAALTAGQREGDDDETRGRCQHMNGRPDGHLPAFSVLSARERKRSV